LKIKIKNEIKNIVGIISEEKNRKVLTTGVKYSTDSKREETTIRHNSNAQEYPRTSIILITKYLMKTLLKREIMFL
jgi:hypothetical protein